MPAETVEVDDTQRVLEALPEVVKESKKGYKTTEFWATVIASVLVLVGPIPVPESKEGGVVALLIGAYTVARGVAKAGSPNVNVAD